MGPFSAAGSSAGTEGSAAADLDCAWPPRTMWLRLLACGVAWFGLYMWRSNAAERRVDAGTAAMLVNVGPLLIAVLAGMVLNEGFPRHLLAGNAVAFAGVVVIGTATASATGADAWGCCCAWLRQLATRSGWSPRSRC